MGDENGKETKASLTSFLSSKTISPNINHSLPNCMFCKRSAWTCLDPAKYLVKYGTRLIRYFSLQTFFSPFRYFEAQLRAPRSCDQVAGIQPASMATNKWIVQGVIPRGAKQKRERPMRE